MKNFIILLSFLLLSSCAAITNTSGKGFSINCSGKTNDWNTCYERATLVCGTKGYKVYRKSAVDSLNSPAFSNDTEAYASKSDQRFMFIICGK